ncbi:hypothetical protein JHK87_022880 [Glycine soja]|nr:hypothetical protein JHK87_022880 [Glycine soja]
MKNQNRKKQGESAAKCKKEDYISKLPNSIICNILSFLEVKDAVTTSVLSSKWRNISCNPSNLILDEDNMLIKREHSLTYVLLHQSVVQRLEFKRGRTLAFVSNVNMYLSHVEEVQKIDKLKVCFTFRHNEYGSTDLDRWIRFAVEKNVEEIDLCLLEENHHHLINASPNDGYYVFPCEVVGNYEGQSGSKSFLKSLRLAHCVLAPHMLHNLGFSTLTTMELFKVDLKSELHIQILLSSCSNLEFFGLSECYNMKNLKIEHPYCQKLKYLKVKLCQELKKLVLYSTSLEALEFKGSKIEFVFDAPRLKTFYSPVSDTDACHKELWPVFRLPIDIPQLETLIMECSCNMGKVMTNRLPTLTFPCLRHLEVIKVSTQRQDLWWVARTLKACPMLQRLELHLKTYLCIDDDVRERGWPPKFEHNHLKEVVITGIKGYLCEIEIAIYLLRNAISLEKMTIDPRAKVYIENGKWGQEEAFGNWSRVGKPKVHRHLKQEANSSAVELLIK